VCLDMTLSKIFLRTVDKPGLSRFTQQPYRDSSRLGG